ncbi:MAG: DUF4032 domain-containing protein [Verrucomicrobia bacterium]|nr:DUF4032 domain-containing protein [Verrucomicrobiota bacterium]
MSDEQNTEWIESTRLFKEWQAVKHEISQHKWYESEKAGRDIGWERATVDWLVHYGDRSKRRSSSS